MCVRGLVVRLPSGVVGLGSGFVVRSAVRMVRLAVRMRSPRRASALWTAVRSVSAIWLGDRFDSVSGDFGREEGVFATVSSSRWGFRSRGRGVRVRFLQSLEKTVAKRPRSARGTDAHRS